MCCNSTPRIGAGVYTYTLAGSWIATSNYTGLSSRTVGESSAEPQFFASRVRPEVKQLQPPSMFLRQSHLPPLEEVPHRVNCPRPQSCELAPHCTQVTL